MQRYTGPAHLVCALLQTDSYLEQLTDTVAETEMSTQTDPFRDRPATPLFIPKKAGLDATTQIEAGDLFDFDFEVSASSTKVWLASAFSQWHPLNSLPLLLSQLRSGHLSCTVTCQHAGCNPM